MLLQRAAVLWLFGRLIVTAYAVLVSRSLGTEPVPMAEIVCLGTVTSLAFSGLVAALTFLDVLRRHELVLLANLGVSRTAILGLAAAPALLLEAVTCLIPV